ncbi:Hypothetical protein SMB2099_3017 [Serratia marcescens SMB2099]|nr:Hypothetical protein SMB2099_3017 [Serratia marcescens SMB2099]
MGSVDKSETSFQMMIDKSLSCKEFLGARDEHPTGLPQRYSM